MKLYAEVPHFRRRQVAMDISVLAWVALWAWAGDNVHDLILRLAGPGRAIESAGSGLEQRLEAAGRSVQELPVVGDALASSLNSAARAGGFLEGAGASQVETVTSLGLWMGTMLALIPISLMLLAYLPRRVRWIREAAAAARLRIDAEDLHLFALRAIATRPLHELRRATPDPARALATGDYGPLAAIELGALGLTTAAT